MHEHLFEDAKTDGQDKIDGVDMTVGYVVGQLYDASAAFRTRFHGGVKIRQCESKDLSTECPGFTSKIIRLTVHFTDRERSPAFSTVLKVLSLDRILGLWSGSGDMPKESAQKTLRKLTRAHNAECDFYTMFGDKRVPPLANCFLAQRMEVEGEAKQPLILALDDLSQTARVNKLEVSLSAKKVGSTCVWDYSRYYSYSMPRSKCWWPI